VSYNLDHILMLQLVPSLKQAIPCMRSLSKAALSYRKHVSSRTFHDNFHAQEHDKMDTMCVYIS